MRWVFTLGQQVLGTVAQGASYLLPRRDQVQRQNKAKHDDLSANSTNMGNYFNLHKPHNHCDPPQNQVFTHVKSGKVNSFHF